MSESARLPVEEVLPELRARLAAGHNAVLVAPPGAGKSTVVPLALLEEPWTRGQRILLLEPRRLAARAVASRMAATLRERPGDTVGWRMRLDTRIGPHTRLEVVTEGILTRMLQQDPALDGVAAVIFDEFHERSLHADLGLALCREAQDSLSLPLRLLVMSATIDAAAVAARLGDAPVIEARGRAFPVAMHYLGRGLPPLPDQRTLAPRDIDRIAAQVRQVLDATTGDVLVFLPGTSEIHRLRAQLEQHSPGGFVVHALYGDLRIEAQQQVLEPDVRGLRKVILATNLAETSLTIEGVRVVIDSGLARRSLFDPGTGMERLVTVRVSQASAAQRAGRAGRTAPGSAWRLWGEGALGTLAPQTPPEIFSSDLAPLALELAKWGARDVTQMPWMDPPPPPALAQARDLLRRLEALDAQQGITATGSAMLETGLHPRLAHMLVRARGTPLAPLAANLAALLSERDLLRTARDADIRTRLELLRGEVPGADRAALARVRELARRLSPGRADAVLDAEAGTALAWAYPDRVAQLRAGSGGAAGQRYLLANGRGALLEGASTLAGSPYLVALDLDDAEGAEAHIRLAAPLSLAQLERALERQITQRIETDTDPRTGAPRARHVRRLDALVLEERRAELDAATRTVALLEQVRRGGLDSLQWGEAGQKLRARLAFAESHRGEALALPPSDDATLLQELPDWLGPCLGDVTRLEHIDQGRLVEALLSRFTYAQRRAFDEFAPTHVAVPTGSRIAVDYEDDNAPCIDVRMQEVFGLADTPRIARGTVPLTLKLLSPARRPMQITRDLAGFWRGSYADVRKDMRGRYPRHYWPENPLEAEPVRGLKPRK